MLFTKMIVWNLLLLIITIGNAVANLKESVTEPLKSLHHNKKISLNHQRNSTFSESRNNTQVVAQIGGTAVFRCYTQWMPDQLVTWMKRGDEQLLTAGLQVYSAEKRLSVSHLRHHKVWELRIRDVKHSDSGIYDCQVTTHPPASILFILKVVEAQAVIRGPKELHVHEGSRLKLNCHVDMATEPPIYVFWFHNETMINFEAKRPLRVTKQLFSSSLTITNVSKADAGRYRCEPYKAISDNVTLHVIAGVNSAAMQRDTNDNGHSYAQTASSMTLSSTKSLIGIMIVIIILSTLVTKTQLTDDIPTLDYCNSRDSNIYEVVHFKTNKITNKFETIPNSLLICFIISKYQSAFNIRKVLKSQSLNTNFNNRMVHTVSIQVANSMFNVVTTKLVQKEVTVCH